MSTHRYKLLNGGGVMKMKRWFGLLWRDYENFDNKINTSEHKLHELWVQMQTEKANHSRLLKEKASIIKSIDSANGKQKGMGEPFGGKPFSGFRKPDVDKAPSDWKDAFSSQKRGPRGESQSYTLADLDAVKGAVSWPIPKESGGNNNQNNNRNNNSNRNNNGNN